MKSFAPTVMGGVVGAALISSIVFWAYLASLGEEQSQILFRHQTPNGMFLWSAPLGAFIGVCYVVFVIHLSKRGASNLITTSISWLLATIIGIPLSFLWAYVSAFSFPTASSALLMSFVWLVLMLGVGIGWLILDRKKWR